MSLPEHLLKWHIGRGIQIIKLNINKMTNRQGHSEHKTEYKNTNELKQT